MDPFIGQLMCVGFNFVPKGWALCDGSLMSIASNTALFSLLGTAYGGDGVTKFALPDLRGRSPIGVGTGPGFNAIARGELGGAENVTLTVAQMPQHAHMLQPKSGQSCTDNPATTNSPVGNVPAAVTINVNDSGEGITATALAYAAPSGPGAMAGNSVGQVLPAGGSQPVPIRSPYLGMYWIIATEGVYPPRQ